MKNTPTKSIPRSGLAAAAALLLSLHSLHLQAGTCNINFSSSKQTIRGFGVSTIGWQGGLTDAEIQKAFTNGGGTLGFDIARIEAPANSDTSQYNWTSEPQRGAKAKSHGAIVFATPWSPPAEMKSNNDTIGGSLNTSHYANYKNHLVNYVNHCNSVGSGLYAISVQNEPDYLPTYVSCGWTATQLRDFVKGQMGAFYSTKVIASEAFGFNLAMTDPILNDSTASNNLDIVGGHLYGATIQNYALAQTKNKEIWMTEYFLDDQSTAGVLKTAKQVHDCLHTGQYNAYVYWYLTSSNSPLDDNGNRTKRGCVLSQWSRAVQPGYVRVDTTANPSSGVYVTAFKGSGKYVIVAVNNSTSAVSQQFSISGATPGTMTRWRTSSGESLSTIASINAASSFWMYLPAQSVTTLFN